MRGKEISSQISLLVLQDAEVIRPAVVQASTERESILGTTSMPVTTNVQTVLTLPQPVRDTEVQW